MPEDDVLPAVPASPVVPYLGGKRVLARQIAERLRAIPHTTYAEPFFGAGGVFFRRPFRARAEVINDLSLDAVTLMRVLQRHYQALMDMLRWQITARAEFERLTAAAADTLTDLERAARFLYLQRTGFGGKVVGRSFGVSAALPGRFDVTRLGAVLEAAHARLAGVVIERLPYAELLARYDRPETLFYLDPPYWGSEDSYGRGLFDRAEFQRLAELLPGLQGQWILSLNDTPEVRRLFRGFQVETVRVSYSVGTEAASRAPRGELIISLKRR